jgi:predicted nucleic acid-binding Zn ribbon protein
MAGMAYRRRRSGLRQLSSMTAEQLGLPRRRARELDLQAAWSEAAGEAIAQRARPLRIARGVLELEVEDERWIGSLRELVPRLAGRLAARHPELGVRRLRLQCGGRRAEESFEVEPYDVEPDSDPVQEPRVAKAALDIEQVSERYLRRARPQE